MCPYRRRFHSFTHRPPHNRTASKSHILSRAGPSREVSGQTREGSARCALNSPLFWLLALHKHLRLKETGSVPPRCMWAQWLRLLLCVRACVWMRISIRLHADFCRDVEQPQWKEVICFVLFSFKSLNSCVHSFLNTQCFAEVFHYLELFHVLL